MGILSNSNSKNQGVAYENSGYDGGPSLMKKVLFVCIENAGRSKMAEGFARAYGLDATSAGTMPAEKVNPVVVQAMTERDISIPGKTKILTEQMITEADLVVTMGCSVQEVCPAPLVRQMQKKLVDWQIEDPKGKGIDEVRKISSQIESKVMELLKR